MTTSYAYPSQETAARFILLAFVRDAWSALYHVEARLIGMGEPFRVLKEGLKDGWAPHQVMDVLGKTFGERVRALERLGLVEVRVELVEGPDGRKVLEGRRTDKGEALVARVIAA